MSAPAAPFPDRERAGAQMAARLGDLGPARPLVLAVPDGGVAVALPIARALEAPLALVMVDSGTPTRIRLEAEARMRARGAADLLFDASGGAGRAELHRVEDGLAELTERLGHHDELPPVDGRTVILVDDGLSPDPIVHGALRAIRFAGARSLTLATPFLTRASADLHDSELDRLVALRVVDSYGAATDFYHDPTPPDLEQIRATLEAWRATHPLSTP